MLIASASPSYRAPCPPPCSSGPPRGSSVDSYRDVVNDVARHCRCEIVKIIRRKTIAATATTSSMSSEASRMSRSKMEDRRNVSVWETGTRDPKRRRRKDRRRGSQGWLAQMFDSASSPLRHVQRDSIPGSGAKLTEPRVGLLRTSIISSHTCSCLSSRRPPQACSPTHMCISRKVRTGRQSGIAPHESRRPTCNRKASIYLRQDAPKRQSRHARGVEAVITWRIYSIRSRRHPGQFSCGMSKRSRVLEHGSSNEMQRQPNKETDIRS